MSQRSINNETVGDVLIHFFLFCFWQNNVCPCTFLVTNICVHFFKIKNGGGIALSNKKKL